MLSSDQKAKQVRFIEAYWEALEDAKAVVGDRPERNSVVSLPEMFPHGVQDIAFVIYMKAARLLGYVEEENIDRARDELQDIINYAGFGMALQTLALPSLQRQIPTYEIPLVPLGLGGEKDDEEIMHVPDHGRLVKRDSDSNPSDS